MHKCEEKNKLCDFRVTLAVSCEWKDSGFKKRTCDTKVQNSCRDAGDEEGAFPEATLTVWCRRS